jgi:hypothetical protein
MKKFHIALAVTDIEASVIDYAQRLGCSPVIVIPREYALWRSTALNLSIRRAPAGECGTLRHLGWEDPASPIFSAERDVNGILWEHFSSEQQAEEIRQTWPGVAYRPR